MPWGLLADAVLLFHAAFVGIVVLGGLAVLRWPRLAWAHLPALAGGAFVIGTGRICPLTPLENAWREAAGQAGYTGGFIDHYVTLLVYPPGITRAAQIVLAAALVAFNAAVYLALLRRRSRRAVAQA